MLKLRPYQNRNALRLVRIPKCALLDPMGSGKTATVVTALDWLYAAGNINRTLVLAPKRVAQSVWPAEVEKWSTLGLTVSVIMGTPKQRIVAVSAQADIYVTNYDNLMWLSKHHGRKWPYEAVVCDEASMLKHHNSKRSMAALRASKAVRRWVNLTGTPASNGIGDLWHQVKLLDGGKRLFPTLEKFRNKWMEQIGLVEHNRWGIRGSQRIYEITRNKKKMLARFPNADTSESDAKIEEIRRTICRPVEQEILSLISDICFSLDPTELDALPPLTYNNIMVDLPPKVMQMYKEFQKDYYLEFPEGGASSPNAAAAAGKCLQLANGAVYLDDTERDWEAVHSAKLDALNDVIEEAAGDSVLVFYTFISDKERILRRFTQARHIDDIDLDDWNRGEVPVLIAHPASASYGLNIQHGGSVMVWFGMSYDLERKLQADARLHRPGQKQHVFIHHILARGTLDEDVLVRLAEKKRVQDNVLERLVA